ncbi:hypothetical protein [uncultured Dysosmobacter sp.]|uniref:hypothetical protein n=1 Tax=uncultured Dysosmobacter sp. TaxID=2591384 RepID=UPI002625A61C|nr:hypothetical protein [uncultured Dysosmobacter sp.]
MTNEDKIFEEALAHIQELSEKGVAFQGKSMDPDQSAKFEVLKQAAGKLAESPFVERVTVSGDSGQRNGHIQIDLPAAATFRADRKETLPAILNLADTYTFVTRNDGGIRVTATILDLWRE